MKVLTRTITTLLAGSAVVLVAGCSAGGRQEASDSRQNPVAQAQRQSDSADQRNASGGHDATSGYVQLGHMAPNAPMFNGFFARFGEDGKLIASGGYGNLWPYTTLPTGRYVWSMRPSDSPANSPLTLTKLIEVKEGQWSSVVLFNNGPQGALQGVAVPDDTATPPAGKGKIRVVQGAVGAPLSVSVGEWPAQEITYGTVTPYQNVPAGPLTVRTAGADNPTTVDVAPGSLNTVLITRTAKGVRLASVTDSVTGSPLAAGSPLASPLTARTPTGANTGSGGLAAPSRTLIGALAGGGALLVSIAGALLAVQRRRNAVTQR